MLDSKEKQRGMCRAFERRRKMWTTSLFLAALLDALATSVQGALAAGLLGHLLTGFLVCKKRSEMTSRVKVGGRIARTSNLLGLESGIILVLVFSSLLGLLV